MGFALWIEDELAWAQGLHEYRPMGVAVVSLTDRFRLRDFHPRRRGPSPQLSTYAGLFPSLEAVNRRLKGLRRSPMLRKKLRARKVPALPWT